MNKTNNVLAQYTFFQKLLAVVLLFSVLTTTFLTTNLGFEGLFGKTVKAKVEGAITSFINVPESSLSVDAGIAKEKIEFPKVLGANVEKDGNTKKVYFNAAWECDSLPQATDKTQLNTKYVFTLAESCVPADLGEGVKLPTLTVEAGKYCIKGFEDLSADLVVIATTPDEDVSFPETVKAYIGFDSVATEIKVNWTSPMGTVAGGTTRKFTDVGSKHAFQATIAETNKYYLAKELTDVNIAAYVVPFMTVYIIGDAVAYVGTGGLPTISAAYEYINQNGGSGTIIVNDSYAYFTNESSHDPAYTVVKTQGDNYSDSYFTEPAHTGMVVIKGNTPSAVFQMNYRFYANGPLMFKDITIAAAHSMKERIYANGNDLVMGTGLTCTWDSDLSEGYVKDYSNALRIYGGSANTDLRKSTRVVLLSGDYYLVRGGNEEGGTINGNTYVYLGGTAHTYYQLMGGSRKGTINGSAYAIVAGDAVADSKSGGPDEVPSVAVFGGGLDGLVKGDLNADGVVEGGCHVIINGGTVNAAVTGTGANENYTGNTYVTVCGNAVIYPSSQGAVFGAGDGSSEATVNGNIFVNIFCNARLVKNDYWANVYGTNTYKNVDSNIVMNIFDNANIEGSVNGGAFVANSGIGNAATGEKTVEVNVYGSAFVRLNVYGGSLRKGVFGNTRVSVTENAIVRGNIFGGGQGASSVSEANEYGFAHSSSVYIKGNVSVSDVYGGGHYGYNSKSTSVTIENATVAGNVFGGSQYGGVSEESKVTVTYSEISRNVYGGCDAEGIIYKELKASAVELGDGAIVKGDVYGGGKNGVSEASSVSVENATVSGDVYGGGEAAKTNTASVVIGKNAVVGGDVYGAGKNAGTGSAKIEIESGLLNNIYGGGETAYSDSVEINVACKEDGFSCDIAGEINGLPSSPASESEIAEHFTSNSSYVLKLDFFHGISGKTFNNCANIKSISNFSEVSAKESRVVFEEENGNYLSGITLINLDGGVFEFPASTSIASAFTAGGVYSTAKQNVLPTSLIGTGNGKIVVPARAMTDEEEISANGKVTPALTVYGKITGSIELYVDGEKKSGTYVTSFEDGSTVGSYLEKSTSDYMFKNLEGIRTGHDRNFAEYMANGFDSGAFKLNGVKEVHNSYRVFTTVRMGSHGALDGKNTSNWIIWSAEPYSVISVAKVGENTIDGETSPMADVEFTIYSDKECTKAIETIKTNAKGIALSSDLYSKNATYYVKETKTKDNYTLDDTVYSVVLTEENSGKVVALTENAIINHLKYGTIELFKASDDGVALEGVSFLVTGDNGYSQTIVTDKSGYATTGKILYGKYTVIEVSNPNAGFEAPEFSAEVTVNDEKSSHTLYPINNRVVGKVTLNKVDENGAALEGVSFNVYSDAALENLVDTIVTNANGYAETKNLTLYGEKTTYYVVEAVALEGYLLREDVFEVTLTPDSPIGLAADEGDRVIKNYLKKANIAISKKGEKDTLLAGVEFGIYSDAGCKDLVQTIISDVAGSAVSQDLVLGTYYVKEISNPDKTYIVSDKVYTFELTENGKVYTETIYNVKAGAYISLEKIDSHGNTMEGVKFEIRNASGELIETITTDENGKAISSALIIAVGSENLFTVKEVYAPDYVYINETVFEAILSDDNQVYELNNGEPIVNKVKEGYLTLEKENEDGEKLEGVEFTVYDDSDCKNAVAVIVTGKDGKGISTNLPFGTYYVKETKVADESYVIAANVYTVVLDDENGTETNGKLFVPVSEKPIVNFRAMGSVSLTKENEDGKPLAGVEFTVYDSDMNEITKVYTDENGKAVASNLVIKDAKNGTKYIVIETATLEGYKLNEENFEATLKSNGENFALNDGKAIVNFFQRGQISLTKKSENGDLLVGVEFTVYSDKECQNAVETIKTGADGKATTSSLKLGTYYVKETAPIAPFLPIDTVWEITLDTDEATKELTEAPIINYFYTGFITLVKTDETGKPLSGVEFTVYDLAGYAVEVITTNENGIATSKALTIYDAEGTPYVVKETKGIEGYIMDTTEYTVILKNNGETVAANSGNAIINEAKKGQISLTKESEDGKPLSGVEFTVYSDKDCKNAVAVLVTGADGKAVSSALVLGTYYVKETSAIAPFVPVSDVWAITLDEHGATKELTSTPIINYYSSGMITLTKTDDSGKPLAGVEFTVYTLSGAVAETIVTDENGVATTKLLSINDSEGTVYIVKETKGLYGYEMDSSEYSVLLKNNGETVAANGGNAIINKKLVGKLIVEYKAENDIDNQPVVVDVTVNGNPFVGEYVLNGETFEVSDGKITVKNNDVFEIVMECGETYVVTAETETLMNLVSITYNGEEKENASGTISEEALVQKVAIVGSFVIPAKPGDVGAIFFFSILAAVSAFGLVVLQSKKRSIRG